LFAATEAAIAWHPEVPSWRLDTSIVPRLAEPWLAEGIAVTDNGVETVLPDLFMQQRRGWLAQPDRPAYPQHHIMTGGRYHPRRPPKPEGIVYARNIPWLGQTLTFRAATMNDVGSLHIWMNDPQVDSFWQESGDRAKHERYLSGLLADPHMFPIIASLDGTDFGYFEIYWAKENRLGPFYDAQDHDRGWHVLIGEPAFRGRQFITAWLPSMMHYLFLDDCRTQRIVGEPAAAHHQQLRNLERSGFAKVKSFDFPHKRAVLVMLQRERFFGDRLWSPAVDPFVRPSKGAPETDRAHSLREDAPTP
jgi:RimJ/RimL family protein N-acetyltransferase